MAVYEFPELLSSVTANHVAACVSWAPGFLYICIVEVLSALTTAFGHVFLLEYACYCLT